MAQGTIVQRMGSNADKAAAEINALVDEMLLLLEGAPA
jgi:hypothetical protein